MNLRHNVLLQYSVVTLLLTLLVTLATGAYMGQKSKQQLIEAHLDLYPSFTRHMAEDNPHLVDYLQDPSQKPSPEDPLWDHMDMLLNIDTVFRVKLWNREQTVIWSDRKELIGERFPEEDIMSRLEDGELSYEITGAHEPEHRFERSVNRFLEIYIPVLHEGELIGAVEIYEDNKKLNAKIRRITLGNWVIIGGAGLLLYVLLFSIFAAAYRRQKQINEQMKKTEKVTIYALAYQAGLRDEETGQHLKRTAEYVRILAEELAKDKRYSKYLNQNYIEDLARSAPLHDIGKVGIEDSILRKPGALAEEEFERIKDHCELGARILEEALEEIQFRSFLDIAIHLVRYHHEHWDGKGYPRGLSGEDIPLSARIMAIADVYDALRSSRYYKPAFSHAKSVEIIREERGTRFDPQVADAFLLRQEEFRHISETMVD